MQKNFDSYTIYARYFPCIISAFPFFILWFFLSKNIQLKELAIFLTSLKFWGTISLSVVVLYFYAQVIRITSKYFENKFFISKQGFPTTYLMLYTDNTFSKDYKNIYRKRVYDKFKIALLDEQAENQDTSEARRRLAEAEKQVILEVGNGKLVKKHNIWYGFSRNLIGGSIYSMLFCVFNIALGFFYLKNYLLVSISIILFIFYLMWFVFRKQILFQNAIAYAKQLLAEFINMKG